SKSLASPPISANMSSEDVYTPSPARTPPLPLKDTEPFVSPPPNLISPLPAEALKFRLPRRIVPAGNGVSLAIASANAGLGEASRSRLIDVLPLRNLPVFAKLNF